MVRVLGKMKGQRAIVIHHKTYNVNLMLINCFVNV